MSDTQRHTSGTGSNFTGNLSQSFSKVCPPASNPLIAYSVPVLSVQARLTHSHNCDSASAASATLAGIYSHSGGVSVQHQSRI